MNEAALQILEATMELSMRPKSGDKLKYYWSDETCD